MAKVQCIVLCAAQWATQPLLDLLSLSLTTAPVCHSWFGKKQQHIHVYLHIEWESGHLRHMWVTPGVNLCLPVIGSTKNNVNATSEQDHWDMAGAPEGRLFWWRNLGAHGSVPCGERRHWWQHSQFLEVMAEAVCLGISTGNLYRSVQAHSSDTLKCVIFM